MDNNYPLTMQARVVPSPSLINNCQACGSIAYLLTCKLGFAVSCSKCGNAGFWHSNPFEAVDAWNC